MKWLPEGAIQGRVVLLSGTEDWPRRQALEELTEALGPDQEFDLEQFEAGSGPHSLWFGSVGTSPFLSAKRTVVVRHLLRTDPKEVAPSNLTSVPESGLLVLVADDESGDDSRLRRLATVRSAWENLVDRAGGKVLKFEVSPKQLASLLKESAQERERKMSDRAIQTLLEMTGGSLTRSLEELDKLILYTLGAQEVREQDVKDCVVPSREWNIFKLVDGIAKGQVGEALSQLRLLIGSQNRADEAALSSILPQLSRTFRLAWQAKLFLTEKCPVENPSEKILKWLPAKPFLPKESPFVQRKAFEIARGLSFEALEKGFESVCLADARLKGLKESSGGVDTLERMILEVASASVVKPG